MSEENPKPYSLDCYDEEFYVNNRLEGCLMAQWFVPLLWDTFKAETLVDVGCGCGHYLAAYQRQLKKINLYEYNVFGLEGSVWAVNNPIQNDVDISLMDLRKPIHKLWSYELALCLEVAEHIEAEYADVFIDNLCTLSDTIVFTSAPIGAGGEHHVNEQWPNYWQEKFAQRNYFIDATDTYKMRRGIILAKKMGGYVTDWMMENLYVYKKRN